MSHELPGASTSLRVARIVAVVIRILFVVGIAGAAGLLLAPLLQLFDQLWFPNEDRGRRDYWFFGALLGLVFLAPWFRSVAGAESRRTRKAARGVERIDLIEEIAAARGQAPAEKRPPIAAVCKSCSSVNSLDEVDLEEPRCHLCGRRDFELRPLE